MKQLNEEINRINLMMKSINQNNFQIMESSPIEGEVKEQLGKSIAKELGGVKDLKSIKGTKLGLAFKDMETAIGLYNNPIKLGGRELRTADEIFLVIKDGSLQGKELGRVEKGFLRSRNTPPALRETIVSHFISNKAVLNDIGKNCKNTSELKTYLKGKGYADESVNSIISQMKKNNLIDNKGVISVTTKPIGGTKGGRGQNIVNNPANKSWIDKLKSLLGYSKNITSAGSKIKKFIVGKKLLMAALAVAGGVIALKFLLGGSDDTELVDENGNPIDENKTSGEWLPCIQDLINNKSGQIVTSTSGEISVLIYPSEYPKGIKFYTNGRVMDVETKKMGTYKCKGGVAQINEQSSEIDVDTMTNYVDTAVDDLDGWVDIKNLNSLYNILTSLKGKTFQGKDAIQEFLSLYKEDEGGDDFISDVNSVGVKTLGTKGILAKRQILSFLKGGNSSTNVSPTKGGNLNGVDIIWDGEKQTGGGNNTTPVPKKQIYHDCTNKDFPYEFGCINPKIGDIQKCLGVEPTKGYFGPKTLKSLGENQYDVSNKVITKELYDQVMSKCGDKKPVTTEPVGTTEPTKTEPAPTEPTKTEPTKTEPTNTSSEESSDGFGGLTGQQIYSKLKENFRNDKTYPYVKARGGSIVLKGDIDVYQTLPKLDEFIKRAFGMSRDSEGAKKVTNRYGEKFVWSK